MFATSRYSLKKIVRNKLQADGKWFQMESLRCKREWRAHETMKHYLMGLKTMIDLVSGNKTDKLGVGSMEFKLF